MATTTWFSSEITSGGVTFSFSEPVEVGQFVNGDWFVVGDDVELVSVSPPSASFAFFGYDADALRLDNSEGFVDSSGSGLRISNGLQLNGLFDSVQGFDSYPVDPASTLEFDTDLNVDPGFTGESLVLGAGDVLVKAVSASGDPSIFDHEHQQNSIPYPVVEYVPLVVVSEAPPEGAYRPPLQGWDGESFYVETEDMWAKLPSYSHEEIPSIGDFADDWGGTVVTWQYNGQNVMGTTASGTEPSYYENRGEFFGSRLLAMAGDDLTEDKIEMARWLIQTGIDSVHAFNTNEANYSWVMGLQGTGAFAASMLDSDSLKSLADTSDQSDYVSSGMEENNFLYVTQEMINSQGDFATSGTSLYDYDQSDLGRPEWAFVRKAPLNDEYIDQTLKLDGHSWNFTYRGIAADGTADYNLASHLLGLWDISGSYALRDYWDRIYHLQSEEHEAYLRLKVEMDRDDLTVGTELELPGGGFATIDRIDQIDDSQYHVFLSSPTISSAEIETGTSIEGLNGSSLDIVSNPTVVHFLGGINGVQINARLLEAERYELYEELVTSDQGIGYQPWEGLPEQQPAPFVLATPEGILVTVSDFDGANGGQIERVDIRVQSTALDPDSDPWVVFDDVSETSLIRIEDHGEYRVSARKVNEFGEGPWSDNRAIIDSHLDVATVTLDGSYPEGVTITPTDIPPSDILLLFEGIETDSDPIQPDSQETPIDTPTQLPDSYEPSDVEPELEKEIVPEDTAKPGETTRGQPSEKVDIPFDSVGKNFLSKLLDSILKLFGFGSDDAEVDYPVTLIPKISEEESASALSDLFTTYKCANFGLLNSEEELDECLEQADFLF